MALSFRIRRKMSRTDWAELREEGVNHMLAVRGEDKGLGLWPVAPLDDNFTS